MWVEVGGRVRCLARVGVSRYEMRCVRLCVSGLDDCVVCVCTCEWLCCGLRGWDNMRGYRYVGMCRTTYLHPHCTQIVQLGIVAIAFSE